MIAKSQFRDNIHAYQTQFNPKPVLVFISLGQDKAQFWIYIYIRLKYDHKKSSTDTPTMIYTKHILKTKWRNFCQVLLKEWCKIQSIIFLPNFNYTLKSLNVWKLQILIDCTYPIMTGIFSYHRNHIESCKNWGCQYYIIRQKAHLFKPPSDVYMQVSLWIIIRMVYKWLTAKCPMVSV